MKNWIDRVFNLLTLCFDTVPVELNEMDWKLTLSPNKDRLAEHISAFANHPGGGFLVFGLDDVTGQIVDMAKDQYKTIVERLSNIARNRLEPMIQIDHSVLDFQGSHLLACYVAESSIKPVHIKNKSIEEAFIRSGGCTYKANRHELAGLMLNSKTPKYEDLHASKVKSEDDVLDLLDYKSILRLLKKPIPQTRNEILKILVDERMIKPVDGLSYYITNLGVISAANNMHDFEDLSRKVIRLIEYKGKTKLETLKEYPGTKGYAIGFEGLIEFILRLLPGSEILRKALREEKPVYPEVAIRELVANALIHQDFSIRGAGPLIEIFEDRIEITNPGRLLPEKRIDRLIRTAPQSRNETLASEFRKLNICEERGSGFEKAISAIEMYGLPPLKMQEIDNSFRVTLYKPKAFAQLTPLERVEACYQHCVICYYSVGGMTNTSLRERFRMHEKQRPQVSLVIKDALQQGRIKPRDPDNTSSKFIEYIPFWG